MKVTVLVDIVGHHCCGDEIVVGGTGHWSLIPFAGDGPWSDITIDSVAIQHDAAFDPPPPTTQATVVAIRGVNFAYGQRPHLTDLASIASGPELRELEEEYDEYLVDLEI